MAEVKEAAGLSFNTCTRVWPRTRRATTMTRWQQTCHVVIGVPAGSHELL